MQVLMKYHKIQKCKSAYSFERKKELLVSSTGFGWMGNDGIRKAWNIGLLFPAVSF